jgi:hypothetical protein
MGRLLIDRNAEKVKFARPWSNPRPRFCLQNLTFSDTTSERLNSVNPIS